MTTILVVDDRPDYVEMHVDTLRLRNLSVVVAMTLDELDSQYTERREELAGIILDGCVPGTVLNTIPFIERVAADRENGLFNGILMAASLDPNYRHEMMAAGCSHEANKRDAAEELIKLLTP